MDDMSRLTPDSALEYISGICFKTGPPRLLGVELEWLLHDAADPDVPPDAGRVMSAFARAGRLPLDGRLSLEPGGQWELSSRPKPSLAALVEATGADLAAVRRSAAEDGLRLVGNGREPSHPPRRLLDTPRYAAMEEFFDRYGPYGRVMMCSTASVQVNLDAGTEHDGPEGFRFRWRLAHLLQPVLQAAFCRSDRSAVWSMLDPSRTRPPRLDSPDPRLAYAHYALDARLMCVRQPDGVPWTAPRDTTFRDWLRDGGARPPTLEDLDYHLTTLFPPVRAQGHFELRTIDALPGDGWHVPAAVVAGLFHDATAADQAMAVLDDRRPPRETALACFGVADAALSRAGAPTWLRAQAARYAEEEIECLQT